ncbi:TraR/DksA C4-type zinc finger protein [Streptomyces lonarensis]|uniref:Zinc finger DksA/TraR C4-type domain-containing protein n=1 Tax=Streptomyces lonarensis TaxID=700599 RepID=A0A7X6D1S2_9ACTN|nr:TraR/DksA C4-type zinc finger protein [Streptomyces lonarensis]NJQ06567.1 hypothetical protein [Streptomyces lonarensis]
MVANDDSAARRAVAKKAAKKASGTGRPVASAAGSATAAERSQARRATARAAADHDAAGPLPDAPERTAADGSDRGDTAGATPAGRATRKKAAKRTAGRQPAARGGAARGPVPTAAEHAKQPSGKPVGKAAKGAAEKAAAGRAPVRAPGGAAARKAVGKAAERKGAPRAAGSGPEAPGDDSATTTGRAADGAPDEQTGAEQVAAEKTTLAGSGEPAPESPVDPADLAVRPGEDPWTAEEVKEARAELTADAARLSEEIDATQQALTGLMRDSGDGAGDDQADMGTKNVTREHEMALAGNSREMLRQTRRALARLEAGTYGVCENCGQPIGKARMQAFPRATLCVACKQRLERRS